MITKSIIIVALLLIVSSLGSALFHLVKNKDQPEKVVKALSVRIGLSLLLFAFLFFAFATGLIKPHGVNPLTENQRSDTVGP
ncbi:MAG: twin transmembrane helix small protein [Gammaproteobacteria bacterium]